MLIISFNKAIDVYHHAPHMRQLTASQGDDPTARNERVCNRLNDLSKSQDDTDSYRDEA
jgi:hypothetical protein